MNDGGLRVTSWIDRGSDNLFIDIIDNIPGVEQMMGSIKERHHPMEIQASSPQPLKGEKSSVLVQLIARGQDGGVSCYWR